MDELSSFKIRDIKKRKIEDYYPDLTTLKYDMSLDNVKSGIKASLKQQALDAQLFDNYKVVKECLAAIKDLKSLFLSKADYSGITIAWSDRYYYGLLTRRYMYSFNNTFIWDLSYSHSILSKIDTMQDEYISKLYEVVDEGDLNKLLDEGYWLQNEEEESIYRDYEDWPELDIEEQGVLYQDYERMISSWSAT